MPNSLRDRFLPVENLPRNVQAFLRSGLRPASQLGMFLPMLLERPTGFVVGRFIPGNGMVQLADDVYWTAESGGRSPREVPYTCIFSAVSGLRIKLQGSCYSTIYGVWLIGPGSCSVRKKEMDIEAGLVDRRKKKLEEMNEAAAH